MATEMGEYIVGAYLRLVLECDVVDYNARPPGGGLPGLNELDVVGFSFGKRIAYLCEVATHLHGLRGTTAKPIINRLTEKHEWQCRFAKNYLRGFKPHFMFWSPIAGPILIPELKGIGFDELFINKGYKDAVDKLRTEARKSRADANNPAFRVLQILEHLRDE
jgi:hypothetical protein